MKNSLFFGGAAYNSKADNSGARTVHMNYLFTKTTSVHWHEYVQQVESLLVFGHMQWS